MQIQKASPPLARATATAVAAITARLGSTGGRRRPEPGSGMRTASCRRPDMAGGLSIGADRTPSWVLPAGERLREAGDHDVGLALHLQPGDADDQVTGGG